MALQPNTAQPSAFDPTAALETMRQQWNPAAINKYTAAAESKEQQEQRSKKMIAEFEEAWRLIQNPPGEFQATNNASSPDAIAKQEAEKQAHAKKVNEYQAQIGSNRFYARVLSEYNQVVEATANTDEKERPKVIQDTMRLKLNKMEEDAVKAAFSNTDKILSPANANYNPNFEGVGEAARGAFMTSILSGNFSGAVDSAKNAVKGSILVSLMEWVRGWGREIFMFTGQAEQVKALVSGWPRLLGGEGEKKNEIQSLTELRDRQVEERLRQAGFIMTTPVEQPKAPSIGSTPPANSSASISYPSGVVPNGSPFPKGVPPIPQAGATIVRV